MGVIAEEAAKASVRDDIDELERVRANVRRLGGDVTSLAASYGKLRSKAKDDADAKYFDGRFADSASMVKADLDALDAPTRQIVDGFFAQLGYTRS